MSIDIDFKALLGSYAQVTLFILMLSVGLSTGFAKLLALTKNPSLLVRCVLAAFVLVPLAAMLIDRIIPMSTAMRLGLAMVAICPGAPMIYRKALKGRARADLAGGYQVTMSLLAVVFVPVWLLVFSKIYQVDAAIDTLRLSKSGNTTQFDS
jgi:BASS family bile acid:Na+ symporter